MNPVHALAFALPVLLAALCACASRGQIPPAPPVGHFDVASIDGTDVSGTGLELEFAADGRVTGSTGVNRCSGRTLVEGGDLSFTPLITTRRAGPPAAMERERLFLATLTRVNGWRLANGDIVLLVGGHVAMRLTRR